MMRNNLKKMARTHLKNAFRRDPPSGLSEARNDNEAVSAGRIQRGGVTKPQPRRRKRSRKGIFEMGSEYVIGIDEVGRGPLAGPVTVCAAAVRRGTKFAPLENGVRLDDSKKLSAKSREAWAKKLRGAGVAFAIASVTPAVIDRINVSRAADLAAERCLAKLAEDKGISVKHSAIFLDGGLHAGGGKTIVRADQKITAVKAASVLAKVHRDALMKKLSKKYPAYGFEKHKGYGTKIHLAAIKKHGLSPVHRKTFCRFA